MKRMKFESSRQNLFRNTLAPKTPRESAVRALRDRLSGLREELDQLLSDDDVRWHDFGFTRPIDVRSPNAVTGLILTAGLPGQVFVQHDASARATGYRISWKLQEGSGDPTMVGLFADLSVTLSGLPSGSAITVGVTARNEAGETQPTEANIVVP